MAEIVSPFNGYVCVPYLHSHDSIELKDKWVSSRNIDSMIYVTATFSEDSKPYFKSVINHFILAKFKNPIKMQKDLSSYNKTEPIFVFNIDNVKLDFDKDALILIVDKAIEFNLGARGLRSICETVMLDAMFDVPSNRKVKSLNIDVDYVQKKLSKIIIKKLRVA